MLILAILLGPVIYLIFSLIRHIIIKIKDEIKKVGSLFTMYFFLSIIHKIQLELIIHFK